MSANTSINLTVDATNSGLPTGTDVYMYVVGLVQVAATSSSPAVQTFYRLDSSGMPHVMNETDNTQAANTFPGSGSLPAATVTAIAANYPKAWADYGIPISLTQKTSINLANINPTNCPGLGTGTAAFSGRIYFSVGVPRLPISPTGNPATGYTAPVFTNPPGNLTLFDWIEFSFDSNSAFNGNTTQVDQFGFPLTLNGQPGGSLQGELNKNRSQILDSFGSGLSGPLGNGVLQIALTDDQKAAYPSGIDYLRVISPKTITAENNYNGTLNSFYDDILSSSYKSWESTPLVTNDQSTGYYTGIVPTSGANQGQLVFYQGQYTTLAALQKANPPIAFVFGDVTSYDVWQCENTLAAGGAAQKNVGKMIAAALNRGVISNNLSDIDCDADAPNFYPTGGTWNQWSQMFHGFSENGLAYGFPYDDVCEQNPSIGITGTTAIEITLQGF